uniref:sodium/glutamate symporter n=1 Tax=Ezakiella massiliensis TaxID=1852374 RepID=UPI00094E47A9|nr:sodium/glutamate symporter [Ezakiella massiliensis]
MTIERIDGILNFNADMTMTAAMAALLLVFGYFVRDKVKFLKKYCIPAPVVGGFIFMFVTMIGHLTSTFYFNFDTTLQSFFMLAFFTTVGLGASLAILKKGGILLIIYWLVAGVVSIFQNTIGIGVGKLIGLEAPYALLTSAIPLIGGHGAALSYGNTFAGMGYEAAPLVGAAAATFGLIIAVMVGGPTARRLIVKNNLKPDESENAGDIDESIANINASTGQKLSSLDVTKNVTAILFCMALGTVLSKKFGQLINMDFPTYVGAMFVAVILRNLNEKFKFYKFDFGLVDGIGDVALGLYLSMAMMSLMLWQLFGVAGKMFVVLFVQVIFLVLFAYFVVFRILGKNYDAAVMCAGLLGHALGATPTAIVNLTAVNEQYGMSRKAMMIVPIVGAFLVDIIYQPQTIWFIKTFVEKIN